MWIIYAGFLIPVLSFTVHDEEKAVRVATLQLLQDHVSKKYTTNTE